MEAADCPSGGPSPAGARGPPWAVRLSGRPCSHDGSDGCHSPVQKCLLSTSSLCCLQQHLPGWRLCHETSRPPQAKSAVSRGARAAAPVPASAPAPLPWPGLRKPRLQRLAREDTLGRGASSLQPQKAVIQQQDLHPASFGHTEQRLRGPVTTGVCNRELLPGLMIGRGDTEACSACVESDVSFCFGHC